jgi:pimeloyl-ACP methyl ester carboxylesterase
MTSGTPAQFIEVGGGSAMRRIAVRARRGSSPGLFWLGGFKSDMAGTKALALDAWAAERGRACVRFDYSGHGESGGEFTDGTIGRWLEESLAVFDAFCEGPQVVVGSSMGGWIALLLARALARRGRSRAPQDHDDLGSNQSKIMNVIDSNILERDAGGEPLHTFPHPTLAGMVLIAPAPDFTEELMWKTFSPEARRAIETEGFCLRPSDYGDPYPITRNLIEDGRNHLLLGGSISTGCPVRILQGTQDLDVPWRHAFALTERLPSDDVVLTMIRDGDHRLSRPQDIARILAAVAEF